MAVHGGPDIVEDGLVFAIDAGNGQSYVSASLDTTSIIPSTSTGSLKNDIGFSSNNQGIWSFDGVDDHIEFAQTSGQYTQDPCSFEFWVKLDNVSSTYPIVIDFVDGDGIQIYAAGVTPKWYMRGQGAAGAHGSTATISFNTWYHIIITFVGTSLKFYIDGQLDSTATWSAGVITSAKTMYLGVYRDGSSYEWEGNIANMKIYHKELSAAEVLQNYNTTKERFI